MIEKKEEKERSIVSMDNEIREEVWDDLYLKEEGVIIEFDPASNIGKVKSISDNAIYEIDGRELLRTRIDLRPGDKVLFAPIEDASLKDFARIIRIIELNA